MIAIRAGGASSRLGVGDRGQDHLQRGLEGRVGDPGQRGADVGHVDQAEGVAGGDAEQLAAAYGADRAHRRLGVVAPAARGEHLLDDQLVVRSASSGARSSPSIRTPAGSFSSRSET